MRATIENIKSYLKTCLQAQECKHIMFDEGLSYNDLLRNEVIKWLNHVVYRDYNVYTAWIICKEITNNLNNILLTATTDDLLSNSRVYQRMKRTIKQDYIQMLADCEEFQKAFCSIYSVFDIDRQIAENINRLTNITVNIIMQTYKGDYCVIDKHYEDTLL